MESAIWLIIFAAVFFGIVVGGFWVIAKAQLPQLVSWVFGGIVLVILVYALVYLVRDDFGM